MRNILLIFLAKIKIEKKLKNKDLRSIPSLACVYIESDKFMLRDKDNAYN